MFKSNKKKVSFGKVETLISKDTQVDGTIEAEGTIRVDGTIRGGIQKAEAVIIGDSGIIEGNINANAVSLAGQVKGDIRAENSLELLPDSSLIGDTKTSSLSIAEGAHFDGSSKMLSKNDSPEDEDRREENDSDFKNPQEPT